MKKRIKDKNFPLSDQKEKIERKMMNKISINSETKICFPLLLSSRK